MSKELEALEEIRDFRYGEDKLLVCQTEMYGVIKSALQRLEAIDNAKPSEALKITNSYLKVFEEENVDVLYDIESFKQDFDIIKQALLKAEKEHNSINLLMQELDCKDFADLRKYARCGYQTFRNAKGSQYHNIIIDEAEQSKQYLKWEDLEFSYKEKYMKVKLNGNIYTLMYTRNALREFPVAYLEFDNTEITIIDCKKQFFNDLRLERVEE